MSEIEVWLVIISLAVATLIARSSFWLVGHKINLPKRVQEALRYAPACALVAIIVHDLLLKNGELVTSWQNPRLIAGIAATIFFLLNRSMLLTILFGMLVYTGMRLF
jgi:branched-subunit amino acid transport protein